VKLFKIVSVLIFPPVYLHQITW